MGKEKYFSTIEKDRGKNMVVNENNYLASVLGTIENSEDCGKLENACAI